MSSITSVLFTSFLLKFVTSRSDLSCMTSGGPASGQLCVFPFKYQGITHHTCADWIYGGQPSGMQKTFFSSFFMMNLCYKSLGTRWCSTKTDRNGNHVNGQGFYGFCPNMCASTCKTLTNKACIFPFIYKNKTYTSCTDVDSVNGAVWCATKVHSNGVVINNRWEDCGSNCLLDDDLQGVCPPLAGNPSPPGCSKTFIEDDDGDIPCQEDLDCPENKDWWIEEGCSINGNGTLVFYGICDLSVCSYFGVSYCQVRNGRWNLQPPQGDALFSAGGYYPDFVSPTASVRARSSCQHCQNLQQCPPNRPCKRNGGCSRPYCTRRGRCWCPRYYN